MNTPYEQWLEDGAEYELEPLELRLRASLEKDAAGKTIAWLLLSDNICLPSLWVTPTGELAVAETEGRNAEMVTFTPERIYLSETLLGGNDATIADLTKHKDKEEDTLPLSLSGAKSEKPKARFCIRSNNSCFNEQCAICGDWGEANLGPEIFVEGTWNYVCEECAMRDAPDLLQIALLARQAFERHLRNEENWFAGEPPTWMVDSMTDNDDLDMDVWGEVA